MKNMPTTVSEQLRRLGKRASIVERQCCAAAKLGDEGVMLDIMMAELDGVYTAISMVLDEVPELDEQTMHKLTRETLSALCAAEQAHHDWIVKRLARYGSELNGFLSAQEQHSRTKLAAIIAELEYRRTRIAGRANIDTEQLALYSA